MKSLKQFTLPILKKLKVYNFARWIYWKGIFAFWLAYDFITLRRKRKLSRYLKNSTSPRLHVGCGGNYLSEWFNTDLNPNSQRTRLNATKRFPYEDNTFSYVYTEHMIEHIPYQMGRNMLRECNRVLKPGGVLRVVTPDIRFLFDLYQNEGSTINKLYIEWTSKEFLRGSAPSNPVSVVNNFFRDWGHQYIYDEKTLSALLVESGFSKIKRMDIGDSQHPELRNLEHSQRMPDGFLKLESMVLEAQKP